MSHTFVFFVNTFLNVHIFFLAEHHSHYLIYFISPLYFTVVDAVISHGSKF